MKTYTDLEQSKKLTKILPLESADMCYQYQKDRWVGEPAYKEYPQFEIAMDKRDIPCWSLSTLLSVLDFPSLTQNKEDEWEVCVPDHKYDGYIEVSAENPIDACYEMIIHLNKLKML